MNQDSLARSIPFNGELHNATEFDCGDNDLNSWLQSSAQHARRMGTAGTFVWVSNAKVVGYYALAPHVVASDILPKEMGRGSPVTTPCYLIGKLAIDRSLQGRGAGAALLLDALIRVVSAATHIPGRFVIVDAVDQATVGFYETHGFVRCPGSELALAMKITTAAKLIGGDQTLGLQA